MPEKREYSLFWIVHEIFTDCEAAGEMSKKFLDRYSSDNLFKMYWRETKKKIINK